MSTPTLHLEQAAPAAPPRREAGPGYPLEIEHATKRYGAATVVDDLTFTVRPGRVTGFLGPNGAGKSTTMKMLLGLAAPDRGRATIGGSLYRDLPDPARTVGVVLEPNAFHPGRSGRNHLRILARATGIPTDRVGEMLESVDLGGPAADRPVGSYSLGMKQRLSLAAALLGDPPVLVLDEPANGLDPQGIRALRNMLGARAAQGHTVFVSSHLLTEIEHLADDLVVIKDGRLVSGGSLASLQQESSLVRTTAPDQLAAALERAGSRVERIEPDTLIVRGLATDEIGELAYHEAVVLHELSSHTGSLEELFLTWTGDPSLNPLAPTTEEVWS